MNSFEFPLVLRGSRGFALVLGGVHVLAAAAAALSGMPAHLAAPSAVLLVGWGVRQIRVHALRSAKSAIAEVTLRPDGTARLAVRDGTLVPGRLVLVPLSGRWLTVLSFTGVPAAYRTLVLARDECEPESYRRLRVFVRWGPWRRADGAEQGEAL